MAEPGPRYSVPMSTTRRGQERRGTAGARGKLSTRSDARRLKVRLMMTSCIRGTMSTRLHGHPSPQRCGRTNTRIFVSTLPRHHKTNGQMPADTSGPWIQRDEATWTQDDAEPVLRKKVGRR